MPDDRRRRNLTAALGFLQLPPQALELRLLHQWADTWGGVGAIVAGLHRSGYDLHLTQYGDNTRRATFMSPASPIRSIFLLAESLLYDPASVLLLQEIERALFRSSMAETSPIGTVTRPKLMLPFQSGRAMTMPPER